jgi:heat shock protein HslJ
MMRIPAAMVAVLVAFGCETSAGDATVPDLRGTHWTLAELGGEPVAIDPRGPAPDLAFADDGERVTGFAGCNRFSGSFSVDGASLHFGPIAATRMACPHGMELEVAFLRALAATTAFRVAVASLALRDGDTDVARFEASDAP